VASGEAKELATFVVTPHVLHAVTVLRNAIPHQPGFLPGDEQLTGELP
jgi:hypothetical protein